MDWPATKRLAQKNFDGLSDEVQGYFAETSSGRLKGQDNQRAAQRLYICSLQFLTQCCSLLADSKTPLCEEVVQSVIHCCHGLSQLYQAADIDKSKVVRDLQRVLYIFSKIFEQSSVSSVISLSTCALNILKTVTGVERDVEVCNLIGQFYRFVWNAAINFDRQNHVCPLDVCNVRLISVRILACQPSKRECCVEKLVLVVNTFYSQSKQSAAIKKESSSVTHHVQSGKSRRDHPVSNLSKTAPGRKGKLASDSRDECDYGGEVELSETQQTGLSAFAMTLTALEEIIAGCEIQAALLVKLVLSVYDLLCECQLSQHHKLEVKDKLSALIGISDETYQLHSAVLDCFWDMAHILESIFVEELIVTGGMEKNPGESLCRLDDWCEKVRTTSSQDELKCFVKLFYWFGKLIKSGSVRTDCVVSLDSMAQLLKVFEATQVVFAENKEILTAEVDDSGASSAEWRDRVTKTHMGAHQCWLTVFRYIVSENKTSLVKKDTELVKILKQGESQLAAYATAIDAASHSPSIQREERYCIGSKCVKLGHLFYNQGQEDLALPYYRASCQQLSAWCEAEPSLLGARVKENSLIKLYICLSQSLRKVGDIDGAMATITKAVTDYGEYCEKDLPSLMRMWIKLKRWAREGGECLEERLARCVVDEAGCSVDMVRQYTQIELNYLLTGQRFWPVESAMLKRLHETSCTEKERDVSQLFLLQSDILSNHPVHTPRVDVDRCLNSIPVKYQESVVIQVQVCLLRFCLQVKDKLEKPEAEAEDEEERLPSVPQVGRHEKMIGEEEKALVRLAVKAWKEAVGEEGVMMEELESRMLQDLLMMVADVLRACREFVLQLELVSIVRQISMQNPWEDNRLDVLVTVVDALTDLGAQDLPPTVTRAVTSVINQCKEAELTDRVVETLQLSLISFYLQSGQVDKATPMLNQLRDRQAKGEFGSLNRGKCARLMAQCWPQTADGIDGASLCPQPEHISTLVLSAYRYHYSVFSRTSGSEKSLWPGSGNGGMDSLWYKLVELLESTLCLGQVYRHCGDAKRALCYLKEGLALCVKFGLLKWSTMLRMEIAEIMSDIEVLPAMVEVLTDTYLNLSRIEPQPDASVISSQPKPVLSRTAASSSCAAKNKCAGKKSNKSPGLDDKLMFAQTQGQCSQNLLDSSEKPSAHLAAALELAEDFRRAYVDGKELCAVVSQTASSEAGFWQRMCLYRKCQAEKVAEAKRRLEDLVVHVLSWSASLGTHCSDCRCSMCSDPHCHLLALTLTKTTVKVVQTMLCGKHHLEPFLKKVLSVFRLRDVSDRVTEALQTAGLMEWHGDTVRCRDWSVLLCWAELSIMLAHSSLLSHNLKQAQDHLETGLLVLKHSPRHLSRVQSLERRLVQLYSACLQRTFLTGKPCKTKGRNVEWCWLTETQLESLVQSKLKEIKLTHNAKTDKKLPANVLDTKSSNSKSTSGAKIASPDDDMDSSDEDEDCSSADQPVESVLPDITTSNKDNPDQHAKSAFPQTGTDNNTSCETSFAPSHCDSGKGLSVKFSDSAMINPLTDSVSSSAKPQHSVKSTCGVSDKKSTIVCGTKMTEAGLESGLTAQQETNRTGRLTKGKNSNSQSHRKPGVKYTARDSLEEAGQDADSFLFTEESVTTQLFCEEAVSGERRVFQTPNVTQLKSCQTPTSAVQRTLSFANSLSNSEDEFQPTTPKSTPRIPGKGRRAKGSQGSVTSNERSAKSLGAAQVLSSKAKSKEDGPVENLQHQFSHLTVSDGQTHSSPAVGNSRKAATSRTGKKTMSRRQPTRSVDTVSMESLQHDLAMLDLRKEASGTSSSVVNIVLEDPPGGPTNFSIHTDSNATSEHTYANARSRQTKLKVDNAKISERARRGRQHQASKTRDEAGDSSEDKRWEGRGESQSNDIAGSANVVVNSEQKRSRGKRVQPVRSVHATDIGHGCVLRGKTGKLRQIQEHIKNADNSLELEHTGTTGDAENFKTSAESDDMVTMDEKNVDHVEHTGTKDTANIDDTKAVTNQNGRRGRGRKPQENAAVVEESSGNRTTRTREKPEKGLSPNSNNANIHIDTTVKNRSRKTSDILPSVSEEKCVTLPSPHESTSKENSVDALQKGSGTGNKILELDKTQSITAGKKTTRGARKPRDVEKPAVETKRLRRGAASKVVKSLDQDELVLDREMVRAGGDSEELDGGGVDVFDFVDSDGETEVFAGTAKKGRSAKTLAARKTSSKSSANCVVKERPVKMVDKISSRSASSKTKSTSRAAKSVSYTPVPVSRTSKPVLNPPETMSCSTAEKTNSKIRPNKTQTAESAEVKNQTHSGIHSDVSGSFTIASNLERLHTELSSMESLRTCYPIQPNIMADDVPTKVEAGESLSLGGKEFQHGLGEGVRLKESMLAYFQSEGKSLLVDDSLAVHAGDVIDCSEERAVVLQNLEARLSESLQLTRCFPHVTLSGETSKLLAHVLMEQGRYDPWRVAALLGDAASVSLRHQFLALLQKQIREESEKTEEGTSFVDQLKDDLHQLWFPWDQHRYQQVVKALPKGWTVCQMSVVDTPGRHALLLTRMTCDQDPLTVELPSFSDEKGQSIYFAFLDILSHCSQAYENTDDRLWWRCRAELDTKMANVLEGMEKYWIGPWIGMLAGQTSSKQYNTAMTTAAYKLVSVLHQHLGFTCCRGKAMQIVKLMQHTKDFPTILSGVLQLDNIRDNVDLNKAITSQVLDIMPEVKAMELPFILILDKHVANLPLEQLSVMRKQPVTRVPSLSLLHLLLKNHGVVTDNKKGVHGNEASVLRRGVDPSSVFYLLNPDGDLQRSQELLKAPYESFEGWKGIAGEVPTKEQFKEALTQHDLFVYSGHGTGCKYFSSQDLLKIRCRAVPLMFGCSSVKQDIHPNTDADAYFYSYLLAGSPCVMGNLWDVTDRDIDVFGLRIFRLWIRENGKAQQVSLASLVQQARSACRMQWLNGGAPVLYGLPILLNRPSP